MTITIKNSDDIEKFKKYVSDNPTQPLCYVFYKKNLRFPNVHYVGFTAQYGIKKYTYLNNHHKMKNLTSNLNNGYMVKIFIKYDEDGLIRLFKPTLNRNCGTGICGRNIQNSGDLQNIGEIIGKKYEHLFYKKTKYIKYLDDIYNTRNDEQFYTQLIFEKYINKKISNNDREIINDPLFKVVNEEYIKRKKINKFNNEFLFSILNICKINYTPVACLMIHDIYKKNILWHLNNLNKNNNKCSSCGKIYKKKGFLSKHIENTGHKKIEDWFHTLDSSNNKYIICGEILEELKKKDYLISNFEQEKNRIWFYYRETYTYDAFMLFKSINKDLNCSPYNLNFIRNGRDALLMG